MYSIKAIDRLSGEFYVKINKYPDICPCCQNGIHPSFMEGYLNGRGTNSEWLQLVCRCPREQCGLTFLSYFKRAFSSYGPSENYSFLYSRPGMPKPPIIPDTINKVSPSFGKIYSEAMAAESYGLLEICGAGYRKALEFLVKEYIISIGIKEDDIKNILLGSCIEKYLDDNTVKQVAKRAAWLGNDETHFCRKWINKDLEDLKRLLHLTMNAIDNQIITRQYTEEMK